MAAPLDPGSLRVLQVGLGPLGLRVAADLRRRGLGQVVAAVDPSHAGKELAGLGPDLPAGVRVRASIEEVETSGIDGAVVTTVSDLELAMESFRALTSRALAVVSSCEELLWPWLRHPVLAQELHERCVRSGARLLGTGVNPGFLMDALPAVASSVCHRVRSVRVERVQDAATRRLPFRRKIGAGLTREAFERGVADGRIRHVGLGESLHFVAHQVGLALERWEETIEPVLAERETEGGPEGPVAAGAVRGVRQRALGFCDGEQVLELLFVAALEEPEPHERIAIEGEPSFELVIPGGLHGDVATSAVLLNALFPLLEAPAGLHTMASLPFHGCAAPPQASPAPRRG